MKNAIIAGSVLCLALLGFYLLNQEQQRELEEQDRRYLTDLLAKTKQPAPDSLLGAGEQVIQMRVVRRFVIDHVPNGEIEGWRNFVEFTTSPDGTGKRKYYAVRVDQYTGPLR